MTAWKNNFMKENNRKTNTEEKWQNIQKWSSFYINSQWMWEASTTETNGIPMNSAGNGKQLNC